MSVQRITITARTPFGDFDGAGGYERIDGTVEFAADPAHPANQQIVDLDKAVRADNGRVHFTADLCILRPVDAARGNRSLLFDVVNRGRKLLPGQFNRASRSIVTTAEIDPGDGFLMRHGWTLVFCGWQWDVVRSSALMGLDAPQAVGQDGQPLTGQIACMFQLSSRQADQLLADRIHQPYPAASLDQPKAMLTVREHPNAPVQTIERSRWQFARIVDGKAVPDPTRIALAGGFEPGNIYQVVYETAHCPVVGAGLLAVRDITAHLRRDTSSDNPLAGTIDHAFAFGASQSGRFLRTFLYHGLNVDEAGRQVYDGVHIHIAGGRRGEFNMRYGQPSAASTPNLGHLPPFSYDAQTDPLTGEQLPGLLDRQRSLGGVPKIVATNTAAEYWRGDGSLLHTDLSGKSDVPEPENTRAYLFAGTQHTSGAPPLTAISPLDGAPGGHSFNIVDYAPLTRAALTALRAWVVDGAPPPPSCVPRLADGSAVTPAAALSCFARLPGVTVPDAERLVAVTRLDLGPAAPAGIGAYPPVEGAPYPVLVSAVDSDGNETAGIRLPDLSVPLATTTGWNPRHPDSGGAGQIMAMLGSTLPLARTAEERARSGDSRPVIAERYRNRADYLDRVHAAAEVLAGQRYLLPEDVDLLVETAATRWQHLAGA